MRGDDGDQPELETIDVLAEPPIDEEAPIAPPAPTPNGGRRALVAAIVVALIVGVAVGIPIGRRGRSTSAPLIEPTPASPAPTTPVTVALKPVAESRLRVLFTQASPDGSVVVARAGAVPIAEAHICGLGVPVVPNDDLECRSGRETGVRFDFSSLGSPWYRLTVLDADVAGFPQTASLEPVMLASLIRLAHGDGSSTPLNTAVRPQLAAFRASGIAKVRVHLASGRTEEMTPVAGWVAFAADGSNIVQPFGVRAEGLDAQGQVVATAAPFRCC